MLSKIGIPNPPYLAGRQRTFLSLWEMFLSLGGLVSVWFSLRRLFEKFGSVESHERKRQKQIAARVLRLAPSPRPALSISSLNLFGTIPFPPVVISFRSSTLSRQKFFDTSNLLQPSAFIPEGPVAPFVRREAVAMVASPMLSKMTGKWHRKIFRLLSGCFYLRLFLVMYVRLAENRDSAGKEIFCLEKRENDFVAKENENCFSISQESLSAFFLGVLIRLRQCPWNGPEEETFSLTATVWIKSSSVPHYSNLRYITALSAILYCGTDSDEI